MSRRGFFQSLTVTLLACCVYVAFCSLQAHAQSSHANPAAGGLVYLNPGMPPVMVAPNVGAAEAARQYAKSEKKKGGGGSSADLYYHGGPVETTPKIYLILWGSQWNNNDPSGEEAILVNFFKSVSRSSWSNTDTQYCQGAPSGSYFCSGSKGAAGNKIVFAGAWYDNAIAAPSAPSQPQFETEMIRAANFFGNTTAASNQNVQYVIATATGNNDPGFPDRYCAWHSVTNTSAGYIAYTNLPYETDAGAACGANFNGLGPNAAITINEGHEMAETITDPIYYSEAWRDSGGFEIGDKCAWIPTGSQGAVANVTFPDGQTFPVQSLWSNAFNSGAGGCVMSYKK